MTPQIDRAEFAHDFLSRIFAGNLHAKRIESLANGALGVMTGASLAVSIIGHSLAQARGLLDEHAIKQVDRLLSNRGIVVWQMFAPWVGEVVGQRGRAVVAMDWTDASSRFDNLRPHEPVCLYAQGRIEFTSKKICHGDLSERRVRVFCIIIW